MFFDPMDTNGDGAGTAIPFEDAKLKLQLPDSTLLIDGDLIFTRHVRVSYVE